MKESNEFGVLAFEVRKDLNEQSTKQQILTGLYHNIHEFSFFLHYLSQNELSLYLFCLRVSTPKL